MKSRISSTHAIAAVLFIAACVLGAWSQWQNTPQIEVPRARFGFKTPLDGKGFQLMLQRMGYVPRRIDGVLQRIPADARVWILIDPQAGFSRREADDLLTWVKRGGTMVWAVSPFTTQINNAIQGRFTEFGGNSGRVRLHQALNVAQEQNMSPTAFRGDDEPLPPLTPLNQSTVSEYWSGVKKASGSPGGLTIARAHLEIAGSPVDTQLARINYGKGRVFVAPDALLFTNYALSKPDNAVLVSNLIRLHVPSGAVYFDERSHGEDIEEQVTPNLLYYLWRPPLRYALLQLLVAAVLAWAFFGRRLGTPVPLPDGGPVTRASQFAAAMGALFHKVRRPRAAGAIIGENFRRQLTRRLGLSISDPDDLIAQRAAEVTGYSSRLIDRLLLQARVPDDDEERALQDAQQMETILRSFDKR